MQAEVEARSPKSAPSILAADGRSRRLSAADGQREILKHGIPQLVQQRIQA